MSNTNENAGVLPQNWKELKTIERLMNVIASDFYRAMRAAGKKPNRPGLLNDLAYDFNNICPEVDWIWEGTHDPEGEPTIKVLGYQVDKFKAS